MLRLRAPVGIYLVGWFNSDRWVDADARKRRGTATTRAEVHRLLTSQAGGLPAGYTVEPFILDCSLG